jgi:hypothetical protein
MTQALSSRNGATRLEADAYANESTVTTEISFEIGITVFSLGIYRSCNVQFKSTAETETFG